MIGWFRWQLDFVVGRGLVSDTGVMVTDQWYDQVSAGTSVSKVGNI